MKQTGMTEMPSPSSNSNISDMSSTRNMSAEEEVSSCVFYIYTQQKIICTFDQAFDLRVNLIRPISITNLL